MKQPVDLKAIELKDAVNNFREIEIKSTFLIEFEAIGKNQKLIIPSTISDFYIT